MSPLTTDGLIRQIRDFRSDKLALVALVGSMGQESEVDALSRLREIKGMMAGRLTEMRKKGKGKPGLYTWRTQTSVQAKQRSSLESPQSHEEML